MDWRSLVYLGAIDLERARPGDLIVAFPSGLDNRLVSDTRDNWKHACRQHWTHEFFLRLSMLLSHMLNKLAIVTVTTWSSVILWLIGVSFPVDIFVSHANNNRRGSRPIFKIYTNTGIVRNTSWCAVQSVMSGTQFWTGMLQKGARNCAGEFDIGMCLRFFCLRLAWPTY